MKKTILSMTLLLSIVACGTEQGPAGRDGLTGETGEKGEKGNPGDKGAAGKDGEAGKAGVDGKDAPVPAEVVSLANYYFLPNGGYLELLEDSNGKILVNGTQRVYITNTDLSLGLLPTLSVGPFTPHNNVIRVEYTVAYVALTNNTHILATATPIVGSRKTVTTLSLNSDNKLVLNTKVYSATGLSIEADKTIVSE